VSHAAVAASISALASGRECATSHRANVAVRIVVEAGPHEGVSSADLRRGARAMLRALQLPNAELSILVTGDDQIRKLNQIYRRKNRPTDVLAFAMREGQHGERAGRLLGDVVVSVPTARRQARTSRRGVMTELTMLVAHGLLHLLGWDHDTPARDRRMRTETKRLREAAEKAVRNERNGASGTPA
jgi:probable rRNA maturation factor